MTKPTKMDEFIDEFTVKNFGKSRTAAIESGVCVFCHKKAGKFKDDSLSAKEFRLSGLCRTCQDKVFGFLEGSK